MNPGPISVFDVYLNSSLLTSVTHKIVEISSCTYPTTKNVCKLTYILVENVVGEEDDGALNHNIYMFMVAAVK